MVTVAEDERLYGMANAFLAQGAKKCAGSLTRGRVLLVGQAFGDGLGEAKTNESLWAFGLRHVQFRI